MNEALFQFSKGLAEESCDNAQRCLDTYNAASKHDYNRIRNLLLARSWSRAAQTNLKIAEQESEVFTTLKPLQARCVAKAVRP
jgi:hypothetical protein